MAISPKGDIVTDTLTDELFFVLDYDEETDTFTVVKKPGDKRNFDEFNSDPIRPNWNKKHTHQIPGYRVTLVESLDQQRNRE